MIKNFNNFINEGKLEQDKINELIDKMSGGTKLTSEELKLLDYLSRGGSLKQQIPVLKTDKTGGFVFDEESGDVMTEESPSKKDVCKEIFTKKGETNPIKNNTGSYNYRVYKNKNSDETRFYIFDISGDKQWTIFRTGGKNIYGSFLRKDVPSYEHFKNKTPEQLWAELDTIYDYGMILDDETIKIFNRFYEIFHNEPEKHKKELLSLFTKLKNLLY